MLLVFDVGNTNTVLGVYDEGKLLQHWRISSDRGKTVDIWISTGYNNQAVFFRGQTFAAVLELVDRPA